MSLISVADYARYAAQYLPKNAYDYYRSGANDEFTLKENESAFQLIRIRPRVLIDVSNIRMATTILGQKIEFPICVAPTAMHRMANAEFGELATSRAAKSMGTLMALSSLSTMSIEEVAAAAPDGLNWFQLYVYKDLEVTKSLIKRAELSGYRALLLTVDTPTLGVRESDVRNSFALPTQFTLANFSVKKFSTDFIGERKEVDIKSSGSSGLADYAAALFDRSLTWKSLEWIKSVTHLPIIVKGILTREDAELACKHGASAILVSNHGARQLDYVPATINALDEVVKAVNGRIEVYLDGGIRRGTDVFKALALGARVVFVGRPILWGLAHSGEAGVKKVLTILKSELEMAMILAGTPTVDDIRRDRIGWANDLRPKL